MTVNRNALELLLQTGGEMFGQSVFDLKDKSPEIIWPSDDIEHKSPFLSQDELNELAQLLRNAVGTSLEKHQNSKIGLTLSGGVDSSLLLYLLKEVYPDSDITAYHTDWKYPPRSELKFAEMAADFARTPLKVIDVSPEAQIPYIDEALAKSLSVSYSTGAIYMAFKTMAEDGIDVALNALGLDELFAGYTVHQRYFGRSRFHFVPPSHRLMNLLPYRYACLKLGTDKGFFFSQNIPKYGKKFVIDSNVDFDKIYRDKIDSGDLWTNIHTWIFQAMVSNYASAIIGPAEANDISVLFPYMEEKLMSKSLRYNPEAKKNKAPIRQLMRETFGFPNDLASRGEQWDKIGWGGTIAPYLASSEYLQAIMPQKSSPKDWFTDFGLKEYRTFSGIPSVQALHMAIFLKTLELV